MGNCQTGCCGESVKDELGTEVDGNKTTGSSITYKDTKTGKTEKPKAQVKNVAKNLKNVRNFEFRCLSIWTSS